MAGSIAPWVETVTLEAVSDDPVPESRRPTEPLLVVVTVGTEIVAAPPSTACTPLKSRPVALIDPPFSVTTPPERAATAARTVPASVIGSRSPVAVMVRPDPVIDEPVPVARTP